MRAYLGEVVVSGCVVGDKAEDGDDGDVREGDGDGDGAKSAAL